MADRDDAMDVGAIEDDALNDDDEENSDEVEEGYKMTKVSGYLHFSNEHRPEVTTRVNAMEGLAPRERSQKIIAELGKMWKALSEQDRVDWKERAPVVKRKIKAKKPSKKRAKKTDEEPAQRSSPTPYVGPETLVGPYPIDEEAL